MTREWDKFPNQGGSNHESPREPRFPGFFGGLDLLFFLHLSYDHLIFGVYNPIIDFNIMDAQARGAANIGTFDVKSWSPSVTGSRNG
jgi:hypothetical protein